MASLTTKQAAARLGYEPRTLEAWRAAGRGPKFVKAEGSKGGVRYRERDLDAWEESQLVETASP